MKSRLLSYWILCLFGGGLAVLAEEPVPPIQLKGIVGIAAKQFAFLEVSIRPTFARGVRADATMPVIRSSIMLEKSQREGEIELLDIDAPAGKVKISDGGKISELAFATDSPPETLVTPFSATAAGKMAEEVSFLRLQRVGLNEVLRLYQILAHRTLLRPSALPAAFGPDLYSKEAVTAADVAYAIEQSLAQRGVEIRPDGDKFAIALPAGIEMEKITSQLNEAHDLAAAIEKTRKEYVKASAREKTSAVSSGASDGEEILLPGTINFPNTDASQVLSIYAELTDRTLIRTFTLPAPTIALRTYTPLRREECIYALSAVFALNGISIATAGEKCLLVVPAAQKGKIASVVSQKGPLDYSSLTNTIPAGRINIPYGTLDMIATVYSQLAGRKVELEPSVPRIALGLRSQTALTAGEALQAFDWLLALHGLKVVLPEKESAALRIVAQGDGAETK